MSFSERTHSVLRKYPQWREKVQQAAKLPPFRLDYSPSVVEIFDQYGLLSGEILDIVYERPRLRQEQSEFVAWCLDGQLGVFYVGSEVVIDRLSLMSASFAILPGLVKEA